MAEFLSDDWLQELDRALGAAGFTGEAALEIEQVVRGVPGRGEVRYRVELDGRGARVRADADRNAGHGATLRMTTDYATAVAIATGRENAQRALAEGRLRIGGDVDVLVRHAAAFAAMYDATASLRSATTFPSP